MARLVELTDGHVRVRPPVATDVTALYRAVRASVPELVPWMVWCHEGYQRAETAEWVRNVARNWDQEIEYGFAIFDAQRGDVLGSCGLNALDRVNRWANLGYWLRTTSTGRGYATRAARLVAGFGFRTLGLERIEILAATDNARSQAVAERLGAIREGVLRRRLRVRDEQQDAVVYSLVREEWEDGALDEP